MTLRAVYETSFQSMMSVCTYMNVSLSLQDLGIIVFKLEQI